MVQVYENPAKEDLQKEIDGSQANAVRFATAVINPPQPSTPGPISDPNIAALAAFFQSLEAPLQAFQTALTTLVNTLDANNSSSSTRSGTS
jgi:hypothetical protein